MMILMELLETSQQACLIEPSGRSTAVKLKIMWGEGGYYQGLKKTMAQNQRHRFWTSSGLAQDQENRMTSRARGQRE